MHKAVAFTEAGRALGLGVMGLHTYFQDKMIPYDSLEAQWIEHDMFKELHEESLKASVWMAERAGEPAWCKGLGVRNTHRLAIAPTKSTALLMGGVSEGINLDPAMTYTQTTSAGEVNRVNPALLRVMKEKNVYNKTTIDAIAQQKGSVQWVDWLTPEEKLVFRTAFEYPQELILRRAGQRGKFLDQWQSLNLFFSADEDEAYIAKILQMAIEDEKILAVYYAYFVAGVQGSKDHSPCEACQ